jgi:hypothetical protein
MTFVRRKINITFQLAEGTFAESGTNTITLSGLRTSVRCVKAGGPSMSSLQMMVFGMTKSIMNKLSTLGMQIILVPRNLVTVEAGDDQSGMGTVFVGTITNAYPDFNSMPDISFFVEAQTGLGEAVENARPTSFKGATSVAVAMAGFASRMGLTFENTGVEAVLPSCYFWGSLRNQAKACAEAAGVNWIIDNGVLAIWPRNKARGGAIPLISPATGLVGYPSYTAQGLALRCLFNPSIGFGSKIKVESDLERATGEWAVYSLAHSLDAKFPHGEWFTDMGAYNPNFAQPVISQPVGP